MPSAHDPGDHYRVAAPSLLCQAHDVRDSLSLWVFFFRVSEFWVWRVQGLMFWAEFLGFGSRVYVSVPSDLLVENFDFEFCTRGTRGAQYPLNEESSLILKRAAS